MRDASQDALRRLSLVQLGLVRALNAANPQRAILHQLADFADGVAMVFDGHGAVVAEGGSGPAAGIWQAISDHAPTLEPICVDRWHALATPIHPDATRPGWLALCRERGRMPPLTDVALRTAAPLLATAQRSRLSSAAVVDGAAQDALFGQILVLDGGTPGDELAARAVAAGLPRRDVGRVMAAMAAGEREAQVLGRVLQRAVAERGGLVLAERRAASTRALVVALDDAEIVSAVRSIASATPLVAGIGRRADTLGDVAHSARDAGLACRQAQRDGGVVWFEDLDLVTTAVALAGPQRLAGSVDGLLGALDASGGIREALVAYFAHSLDVKRAACAIHVHHNTLRYRLSRAEQLLGCSLKDPAAIASLHVALLCGTGGASQ